MNSCRKFEINWPRIEEFREKIREKRRKISWVLKIGERKWVKRGSKQNLRVKLAEFRPKFRPEISTEISGSKFFGMKSIPLPRLHCSQNFLRRLMVFQISSSRDLRLMWFQLNWKNNFKIFSCICWALPNSKCGQSYSRLNVPSCISLWNFTPSSFPHCALVRTPLFSKFPCLTNH